MSSQHPSTEAPSKPRSEPRAFDCLLATPPAGRDLVWARELAWQAVDRRGWYGDEEPYPTDAHRTLEAIRDAAGILPIPDRTFLHRVMLLQRWTDLRRHLGFVLKGDEVAAALAAGSGESEVLEAAREVLRMGWAAVASFPRAGLFKGMDMPGEGLEFTLDPQTFRIEGPPRRVRIDQLTLLLARPGSEGHANLRGIVTWCLDVADGVTRTKVLDEARARLAAAEQLRQEAPTARNGRDSQAISSIREIASFVTLGLLDFAMHDPAGPLGDEALAAGLRCPVGYVRKTALRLAAARGDDDMVARLAKEDPDAGVRKAAMALRSTRPKPKGLFGELE
jgi:hypothetical protein